MTHSNDDISKVQFSNQFNHLDVIQNKKHQEINQKLINQKTFERFTFFFLA